MDLFALVSAQPHVGLRVHNLQLDEMEFDSTEVHEYNRNNDPNEFSLRALATLLPLLPNVTHLQVAPRCRDLRDEIRLVKAIGSLNKLKWLEMLETVRAEALDHLLPPARQLDYLYMFNLDRASSSPPRTSDSPRSAVVSLSFRITLSNIKYLYPLGTLLLSSGGSHLRLRAWFVADPGEDVDYRQLASELAKMIALWTNVDIIFYFEAGSVLTSTEPVLRAFPASQDYWAMTWVQPSITWAPRARVVRNSQAQHMYSVFEEELAEHQRWLDRVHVQVRGAMLEQEEYEAMEGFMSRYGGNAIEFSD